MARITNLEELLAEKSRLESELELQRAIIESEIARIKRKFDPVRKVLAFFGAGKDNNTSSVPPALKIGANLGIDLLGHKVLRRAGWITRVVIPMIAKKISSGLLSKFKKKKATTYNHDDYLPQ
jgi:hypothetical protein